jgi:hydroxyacylglutathione hydrolase
MPRMDLDTIRIKQRNQYVCTVCGFNMVGYYPEYCPFCGAHQSNFITSEECSARYKVHGTRVNDKVTSLRSVPSLGLEHAAYRIETNGSTYWIDCPSSFDASLDPVEAVIFTHHHFLGASNLYRDLFPARVGINSLDSLHDISKSFIFDDLFTGNFSTGEIEAFHIAGHTPGFTFYIFDDVLLICDYVFLIGDRAGLNPFGPAVETKEGFKKIMALIEDRDISAVCGYNYMTDFASWKQRVDRIP